MGIFQNLDLLSVGVAVAATVILGFTVFFNNRKSITNISFLTFTIITSFWGIFNYLSYQITDPNQALWFIRISICCAVWQAFMLFQLFAVFPNEKGACPKYYKTLFIPFVFLVSILTLTPLVFKRIASISTTGSIASIENGPGILLFGLLSVGLVIGAFIILFKKIARARSEDKKPFRIILIGTLLMFGLIITFNFIFPAFLNDASYQPFGALFTLPFVLLTAYAIHKHHLFNAKVITTEILTFILAIVAFLEIVFSPDLATVAFRTGVFILILSFSVLLIRSVLREVEQRERLQKLTEELARANDQLKQLDKTKNEFLSFASHDLKSPIALVKQFASLIYDGTYKDPKQIHETVGKIKNTADRAVNMVNTFLDLRKIEEGRMDYNFEQKNLAEFIGNITSDFIPLAKQSKNIDVSFSASSKDIQAKIDTTTLRQVIQNLLDNSLKYTEKGWIKVRVQEEQKSIKISIADSGLGMDKDLLPILFEQFRRDPSVAKKIQGTGLGLFISKQIVLAHHGDVWAESEGKGMGSQFYVRLPKA